MAPKSKAKADKEVKEVNKTVHKEKKEKEPKAKPKAKSGSEPMDKADVANMLGSLKVSKDPAKKELLALYKGLPRFDSQKAELLKKWKADKSCKWLGEYREQRSQTTSSTQEELSGYVTKYLGCISSCCFLVLFSCFFLFLLQVPSG